MNIGEAARETGVSAKMIRYYETIGLIRTVTRTDGGYRIYSASDMHILRFIKRARSMGFSIEQIEELLALWRDESRSSSRVKALALAHIVELQTKIDEIQAVVDTLRHLSRHCFGDSRPECPILDNIALPVPKTNKRPPDRHSGHRRVQRK